MSMIKKAGLSALVVSLLMVLSACSGEDAAIELTASQEKAVSERLAPEGELTLENDVVATAPAIDASGEPRSGEEIYNKACTTCHNIGVAGAPKLGDAAAWAPRIAKGLDVVYASAISGLNGMPPRGLCMDCSDDELKATVDYMVENSQ